MVGALATGCAGWVWVFMGEAGGGEDSKFGGWRS